MFENNKLMQNLQPIGSYKSAGGEKTIQPNKPYIAEYYSASVPTSETTLIEVTTAKGTINLINVMDIPDLTIRIYIDGVKKIEKVLNFNLITINCFGTTPLTGSVGSDFFNIDNVIEFKTGFKVTIQASSSSRASNINIFYSLQV